MTVNYNINLNQIFDTQINYKLMEKVFGKSTTIKYLNDQGKIKVIIGKKTKTLDIKLTQEPVNKTIDKQLKEREKIQNELNKETKKLQQIFLKDLKTGKNKTNKNTVVKEIGQLTNKIETIDYTLRQLRHYPHKNRTIRTIQMSAT